jgi:NSS family neurotransmitter:Na+ symporter
VAQLSESRHGMWSSRWVFVLAVAGAAMGLGNIWSFAAVAGTHGGGAFVLVYLVCLTVFGIPLMMAEILLGRAGRLSPINTLRRLTRLTRRSGTWISVGWSGTFAGMLILSYTGVFAGWALHYVFVMLQGSLTGADAQVATTAFERFIASPWQVVGWQSLFMAVIIYIVGRGVRGLETAVRWLMPIALTLLVVLIFFGAASGGFAQGMHYLFQPRWDQLHLDGVLIAMGQAFFTLGLGMGAVMAYGAYLSATVSLLDSAAAIVLLDMLVTIGAGLVVLPIVFANGLSPDTGLESVFVTLPFAFAQMHFGGVFGALLFLLIVVAAIVTAIALLEPVAAYLFEEYNAKRSRAAVSLGVIAWVVGLGTVFSFNIWSKLNVLGGRNFIESVDYVVHTWMLPLGALGTALFVAFVVQRAAIHAQLHITGGNAELVWNVFVRLIAPLFMLTVFIGSALQYLS